MQNIFMSIEFEYNFCILHLKVIKNKSSKTYIRTEDKLDWEQQMTTVAKAEIVTNVFNIAMGQFVYELF